MAYSHVDMATSNLAFHAEHQMTVWPAFVTGGFQKHLDLINVLPFELKPPHPPLNLFLPPLPQ